MLGYRPLVKVRMSSDVDATYLPIVQAKSAAINERLDQRYCAGRDGKDRAVGIAADACYGSGYAACLYAAAVRRSN